MDPDTSGSSTIDAVVRAAHRHAAASDVVEMFKVVAAAEVVAH